MNLCSFAMHSLQWRLISCTECLKQVGTSLDSVPDDSSIIPSHTQNAYLMVLCVGWCLLCRGHTLSSKNAVGNVMRHLARLKMLPSACDEPSRMERKLVATCVLQPDPHLPLTFERLLTPKVTSYNRKFSSWSLFI